MSAQKHIIRHAANTDGEAISELMFSVGYNARLDWSDIAGYWLVAEIEREIVGAIQICYGKPMGRLDLTGISPKLSAHRGARIYRDLVLSGLQTLHTFGAQTASGYVPFPNRNIKRFLKKIGGRSLGQGNFMEMRLQ